MQTDMIKDEVSKKFNLNEAIKDVGSALGSALKKPDTYVTYNSTIAEDENKDNTMLYAGIGGAALLLVILLIVFMR